LRSSFVQRSVFVPHDLTEPIDGRSQGPLAGLAAAVKAVSEIVGSAGARQLLAAGAAMSGRTICDGFLSITGTNAHFGTPVNPRAPGSASPGPTVRAGGVVLGPPKRAAPIMQPIIVDDAFDRGQAGRHTGGGGGRSRAGASPRRRA
jgi:hypothetical protein